MIDKYILELFVYSFRKCTEGNRTFEILPCVVH